MRKIIILSIILSCLTSCGSSTISVSVLANVKEETAWCDVKYLECEYIQGFGNKCEKQWEICVSGQEAR